MVDHVPPPPLLVSQAGWRVLSWSYAAAGPGNMNLTATIKPCWKLTARKTKCRWEFRATPYYRYHPTLAMSEGTVTVDRRGHIRWSYDTGARRRR